MGSINRAEKWRVYGVMVEVKSKKQAVARGYFLFVSLGDGDGGDIELNKHQYKLNGS